MISQTIERLSKGRLRIGMHFREVFLWIALTIIIINFIVKNAALLFFQIDFMPLTHISVSYTHLVCCYTVCTHFFYSFFLYF